MPTTRTHAAQVLLSHSRAETLDAAQREWRLTHAYQDHALLDALSVVDDRFRSPRWKATWRLGYSVKQLLLIAARARAHELPFNAADFKINARDTERVKDLESLAWWQYRQLRAALTSARQHHPDEHFRTHSAQRAAARSDVAPDSSQRSPDYHPSQSSRA